MVVLCRLILYRHHSINMKFHRGGRRVIMRDTLWTRLFFLRLALRILHLLVGESVLIIGFSPLLKWESLSSVSAGASIFSGQLSTLSSKQRKTASTSCKKGKTYHASNTASSRAHRTPLPSRSPHPSLSPSTCSLPAPYLPETARRPSIPDLCACHPT